MKRKEKQERFHEALVRLLYPAAPSPHKEGTQEPQGISAQDAHLFNYPDELDEERGSLSSSGADEVESDGTKKLTRAQRKRLRKKKLKEAASSRRKTIGPVLPGSVDDNVGVLEIQPEGVRENAPEPLDAGSQEPEPGRSPSSCSKRTRTNRRRKAKKLTSVKLSGAGNGCKDHGPCDPEE